MSERHFREVNKYTKFGCVYRKDRTDLCTSFRQRDIFPVFFTLLHKFDDSMLVRERKKDSERFVVLWGLWGWISFLRIWSRRGEKEGTWNSKSGGHRHFVAVDTREAARNAKKREGAEGGSAGEEETEEKRKLREGPWMESVQFGILENVETCEKSKRWGKEKRRGGGRVRAGHYL
ncbi:hypothetical protein K0M31_009840 [Melipona bicolor]|uniref:Uncharacterized protein n=1 Tax=Melipona bicolor TaxID=60889 RepID=A0AA40FNA9_9HYME|nr:hypothetical protein K0M31_009840 [Melipona bicolor]